MNEVKPVVLQVLPELAHGGVETGTIEIATYLHSKDIKNFVASQGGRMVRELEKCGITNFTLPLKSKNIFTLLKNKKALVKIIKENEINIVHARSRAPAWSAYWAAKECGVKFLTTFHGTYGIDSLGLKKIYNRVMTYGDLIIAVSNHIKQHIIKNYNVDETKIRKIYRCVDLTKFSPENVSDERKNTAIQENGISQANPVITLPGRISNWKGQELFINALAKIKNKNFTALIVGSHQGRIELMEKLQNMVDEYGLRQNVKFIEHSFDIPALLSISDIVISASTQPEAFGRTTIEGEAMGKIVLASNHGGSLENVIDGSTGRLFKNGDAQDLAEKIEWALTLSVDEKLKMGNAAIENVSSNFTKDKMCSETLAVYRELLK